MLGVIRFLLSFSVIAFHLTAYIPNLGLLAVNFFYVISGFLITLVLHESYNFKFTQFAKNRFLRLYPAYFAVAGISLLLATTFESYSQFHASWSTSPTAPDIFGNLLMFPWAFLADDSVQVNFLQVDFLQSAVPHFRLVPSTWSVGVEIVCYFFLWLFVARRMWTTIATIVAASVWQWYVTQTGVNPLLAYFPVPAALLPFGLGALAFHITKRTQISAPQKSMAKWITFVICVLFIANWKLSTSSPNLMGSIYYYANNLLAFLSVLLINRARHDGFSGKVDKWLGDLAYPMFLGQYVFGFVAWRIIGITSPIRGTDIFLLGSAITIASSILIVLIIDKRLLKARNKVRVSANQESTLLNLTVRS